MSDALTIWTIYRNPSDHPGKWVLRGHDIGPGTVTARPACYITDSYDALLSSLPLGAQPLPHFSDDDPAIYETWV